MKRAQIDEFELEYEVAGTGQTVLLEAGARCGADTWEGVFPLFAKRARVVRYSRVGHGNSTTTDEQFSARQFAGMALKLLKTVGIHEPVSIVAHSYGGRVARQFAACFPNATRGVLLFDPAHYRDVEIARRINPQQANRELSKLKRLDHRATWPGVDDSWDKTPEPDGKLIGDIPVTVIVSAKRFEHPENLLQTDEARLEWAQIHREWADTFPNGQTVVSAKIDHMVIKTNPEFAVEQFEAFLSRIESE